MSKSQTSTIKAANLALYAEGNLDTIGEFFTTDYIAHVTSEDLLLGHHGIRQVLSQYRRAFPDLHVEVEVLVQSKDRVAWQRTLRGTHLGAFKGFPPSKHPIVWRDMVTSRFQGGQIAEEWIVTDLAERLLVSRKR